MIVFNLVSVLQLIVAAIVAAAIAGILYLFGLTFEYWLVLLTFIFAAPIDALWRLASMGEGEDGEPGAGPLALIMPGGGGHLFFLPVWLIGGLGATLVISGYLPGLTGG